jgi:uncharacterized membrane protein YkvA (DUF1232 family)
MKDFDQLLQEDIAVYEGRHDDLIYQAPALYRLFTRMLDDPALPGRLRPLVISTIAYFILPADVIPEAIEGPYGYVDDIYLCAFMANRICCELSDNDIITSNWDGEAPILPLIKDILDHETDLIGDQLGLILKYIAYDHIKGA